MKAIVDYGRIRSTVRPEEQVVDEFSVWVNTDIQEVKVDHDGDVHTEFEFNQVQYSRDEFIEMISEQNKELNHLMNTILGVNE